MKHGISCQGQLFSNKNLMDLSRCERQVLKADIHKNNELNNFVLPVQVSEDFLAEIFQSIQNNPSTQIKVDLPNQTVTNLSSGRSESFEINAYKKHCLINGLDDIDFLVQNQDKTIAWEQQRK